MNVFHRLLTIGVMLIGVLIPNAYAQTPPNVLIVGQIAEPKA